MQHVELSSLDFTRLIRPGDRVIWTQGAGEPISLLENLIEQRHQIGGFTAFLGASYSGLVKPKHADTVNFEGMGAVGTNRAICSAQLMNVIPCHLSAIPDLIASEQLKFDVVIAQVSEMPNGKFGTGAVNGYLQSALANARVKIAELNTLAPQTSSSTQFDGSDFDVVVPTTRPLVEQLQAVSSPLDMKIAQNAANYIGDGDTLQIGIGAIPLALASVIADRRNLGLHSGVIGDGVITLIEGGVITNARNTLTPGRSISGGLAGTKKLFDFAHQNENLWIEPVTFTHSLKNLAQIDNLVSINSAIEVDLTGQVGSEMVNLKYMGTIGGQNDFVRGSLASSGGRSIIALPSRTAKGKARIVPIVSTGIVTVPRSDADIFVTEYGCAELRGRTIHERIKAMISIAHPEDRSELERHALLNWGQQ